MHWKTLLEAVRFILGKYRLICTHGDPFRIVFHILHTVLSEKHTLCLHNTYSVCPTHILSAQHIFFCTTHIPYAQRIFRMRTTHILSAQHTY